MEGLTACEMLKLVIPNLCPYFFTMSHFNMALKLVTCTSTQIDKEDKRARSLGMSSSGENPETISAGNTTIDVRASFIHSALQISPGYTSCWSLLA